MNDDIKSDLETNGYTIIKNVLNEEEVDTALKMFKDWQKGIPNLEKFHHKVDPHGIYKFHQAGHQPHAWYIRTRPSVQKPFKKIWNTDELIVSFDGSCHIPKSCKKKDNIWTHVDQAPDYASEKKCYQAIVALTHNKERTLVVYEGSHKLYEKYVKEYKLSGKNNWQKINTEFLSKIQDRKKVLEVPTGAMVIWDSRTFHQNQYGKPYSEERYVQYVCYLPRDHKNNTQAIQKKRLKYFNERRTTSHWPCPVYVNGLQPQTFGDKTRLIDYNELPEINLNNMNDDIMKLI